MDWILFFIVYLLLIGLASYGISNVVYKKLVREKKSNAKAIRIGTFVISYLALFLGISYLILTNLRFER